MVLSVTVLASLMFCAIIRPTPISIFSLLEHKPCEDLEVQVQIFTIAGKLVKTISKKIITPGTRIDDLTWDGRDDFGDRIGRGVYIYRVKLNTADESASETQKLVILK